MAKKEKKKQQIEPKNGSAKGRLILFALVAGAISGYLFFKSGQNKAVRPAEKTPGQVANQSDPGKAPPPKSWSSGETLPPVSLLSLAGESLELRLSEDSSPVLLFIFSPTCAICTENMPIWKELFDEATSRSVEVVGISVVDTARTARYANQHQIPWDVFCTAGRDAIQALRVERVPMTVLVEGSGTVSAEMRGRLNELQRAKVLQFLKGDSESSS